MSQEKISKPKKDKCPHFRDDSCVLAIPFGRTVVCFGEYYQGCEVYLKNRNGKPLKTSNNYGVKKGD